MKFTDKTNTYLFGLFANFDESNIDFEILKALTLQEIGSRNIRGKCKKRIIIEILIVILIVQLFP